MPHRRTIASIVVGSTLAIVGVLASVQSGMAQDPARASARRHVARAAPAPVNAPVAYRGLTISRPPGAEPDAYGQDDPYADGPVRYNDVRNYSPFPYADSGRQFPFGFDGVGGYGSDLGFNEGQDSTIYDRGAFNAEAK